LQKLWLEQVRLKPIQKAYLNKIKIRFLSGGGFFLSEHTALG